MRDLGGRGRRGRTREYEEHMPWDIFRVDLSQMERSAAWYVIWVVTVGDEAFGLILVFWMYSVSSLSAYKTHVLMRLKR